MTVNQQPEPNQTPEPQNDHPQDDASSVDNATPTPDVGSEEILPSTDEADDTDDVDEDDPRDLTWYEGEVKRLRRQSKNYRTQRNELRQQVADLETRLATVPQPQADPVAVAEQRAAQAERRLTRLEVAGEVGLPSALLKDIDALHAAPDAVALKAAMEAIKAHLRADGQPRNPTPPTNPSTPLSLDAQITAAEAAGDHMLALRLKNQKLRTQ